MNPDRQLQDDVQAVETGKLIKCRSCGSPIRDCDTSIFVAWCDSMRRLLVLKTVQPEQCHRSCFVAAVTAETATKLDGSFHYSALRRSTKVEFPRRRQHVTVPTAAMMSCSG